MSISREMFVAVKCSPVPAYRWAAEAGVSEDYFSKLLHGQKPVLPRHLPGLHAIAAKLGVRKVVSARVGRLGSR
jgi:hypothetical protein